MRHTRFLAALSVVTLATACSSNSEEPVKASSADARTAALAPAPQTYQRMRFVSPVEQSGATRVPLVSSTRHATQHAVAHAPAAEPAATTPDPLASLAPAVTMASVTTSAAPSETGIVVALKAAPQPAGEPAPWSSEALSERRPHAVVMRGGAVGPEKCDALTDARARRAAAERSSGSMRAPVIASTVFSRGSGRN